MSVGFALLLITPDGGDLDDLVGKVGVALGAAPRGSVAIMLRRKQMAQEHSAQLYAWAERLRQATAEAGATLLINDRLDVALAVGADGVHLPRAGSGLPASRVRQLSGRNFFVGVSTHTRQEAHTAASDGADYVTFGPVYAPLSKHSDRPPTGLAALGDTVRHCAVPVFALGGITGLRAESCREAGARIACIGEVLGQPAALISERVAGLRNSRE